MYVRNIFVYAIASAIMVPYWALEHNTDYTLFR